MKIKIVVPKGENRMCILENVNPQNWGEVKKLAKEKGYDLNNMIGVLASSNLTMDMDNALIPNAEEVIIFAYAAKNKSGAEYSYLEAKAFIKKTIAENPDSKEYFGAYTTLSTKALNELISGYNPNPAAEDTSSGTSEGKEKMVKKVDEVIDFLVEVREYIIQNREGKISDAQLKALIEAKELQKLLEEYDKISKIR